MKPLTADQVAFLERFSRTPDARSLVEILSAELRAVEKDLRKLEGPVMHRVQGEALRLDWLLEKLGQVQPGQPVRIAPRLTSDQFRA